MTRESHPPSIDLEAFACGERNDVVAAHVKDCDSCRAFTTEIESASRSFAADTDIDAVIARAERAMARDEEPGQPEVPTPAAEKTGTVVQLADRKKTDVALRVLPFLALAAGVLLWMRLAGTPETTGGPHAMNTAAATNQANTDTTGTAFKGGTQLAVIRERDGVQKRFTGEVSVRKGDRLRIEVALDHSANILGGVLADDGTFLDLLHEGERGTGTFYSEEAARFDDSPTRGYVIVGPRDAVERTRAMKLANVTSSPPSDVTLLRVSWEGP